MRVLPEVKATPEQLKVLGRNRPGVEIIRGAAGSGKTTTALLRLRALAASWANRRRREGEGPPIRALVLTFNRTLCGYVAELAGSHVREHPAGHFEIDNFAHWAWDGLGGPRMLKTGEAAAKIAELGSGIPLPTNFLIDEVNYVLGRFLPEDLARYKTAKRDGRGTVPQVPRRIREAILDDVIARYVEWKKKSGVMDWNDLAVLAARQAFAEPYDIVVVDETQDFSANELRAVRNHLAPLHSLTLVLDTVQRIYTRGFTWSEAGITVRPENTWRLSTNYRNTAEIAEFAAPLVSDLPLDDDATIPDPATCERHGPKPIVARGLFRRQTRFALDLLKNVDLAKESVAFMHAQGWFRFLRETLDAEGYEYVTLTRKKEWPSGPENIGLTTLHSAKGLEFDHVVVLGLNAETTPHGVEEDDEALTRYRRLLAMGISRARKTVAITYKPGEASRLVDYVDRSTCEVIDL